MTIATRSEHDLIGDRDVPLEAYWGVHTLRALENFPITGIPIGTSPFLVEALAAEPGSSPGELTRCPVESSFCTSSSCCCALLIDCCATSVRRRLLTRASWRGKTDIIYLTRFKTVSIISLTVVINFAAP